MFSWAIERLSWGLKNGFKSAMVNELSVVEYINPSPAERAYNLP